MIRARPDRVIHDALPGPITPVSTSAKPERAVSDAEEAGRDKLRRDLADAWRTPDLKRVRKRAERLASPSLATAWENFTADERAIAVSEIVRVDGDDPATLTHRGDAYLAVMVIGAWDREQLRKNRKAKP